MQPSDKPRLLPPAGGAEALSALGRSPRAMSGILCEVLGIFLHLWRTNTGVVTALPDCAAVDLSRAHRPKWPLPAPWRCYQVSRGGSGASSQPES